MRELDMNAIELSVDADQYLTFMLSGEEFAAPIMQVKEIIEFHGLTKVPMVPDFIAGAINLRGNVIPVIKLATKLGMTASETTRRTSVVIMDVQMDDEATVIGVLVDKVLDVIDILDEDINSAPSLGTHIRTDFIRGMGKLGDDFIIILAVDKVLSTDEIAVVASLEGEGSVSTNSGVDE